MKKVDSVFYLRDNVKEDIGSNIFLNTKNYER